MHFEFKNAAAAEMILRTNIGARMGLKILSAARNGLVVAQITVTVDGEELMVGDETVRLYPGDTIEVPCSLEVQFSTPE